MKRATHRTLAFYGLLVVGGMTLLGVVAVFCTVAEAVLP